MTIPSSQRLPWTRSPLIINAPMGGIAGADLAIAVSRAGGLGQIGAVDDASDIEAQLVKVEQALGRRDGLLPIGLGILCFVLSPDAVMPILEKYKPAVVWLFAAQELSDYVTWAEEVRKASPESQIWIQVGSVQGALQIAKEARPDVVCIQGIDAGGHGFEKGAGVISLLPEVADAFTEKGYDIPLVAAGGIADGRAAAASFALGAQGVVMGTRFLSSPETNVHQKYQAAVLGASDGGQTTVRAKLFDELRGPNRWPLLYDGRGIRTESFEDHQAGLGIDEIRRRHKEASKGQDAGFGENGKGRAATWAGTGVGLVKKKQPAAKIVEETRKGILEALNLARAKL